MFTCSGTKFSATLDSKGRITIPADIRRALKLSEGRSIQVTVDNFVTRTEQVDSFEEAQEFIDGFEQVERFSFDGETVEVVLRE